MGAGWMIISWAGVDARDAPEMGARAFRSCAALLFVPTSIMNGRETVGAKPCCNPDKNQ